MHDLLARLPAVHVLADAAATDDAPRWAVVEAARHAIATQRKAILDGRAPPPRRCWRAPRCAV